MKITKTQLRQIIREETARLMKEEAIDPEGISGLSAIARRVTDPENNPQKFAKLDQLLMQKGSTKQQAEAIAMFIANYAQGKPEVASEIFDKLKVILNTKVIPHLEKGKGGGSGGTGGSGGAVKFG